jgi:hydroxymethylbilane synthase
MKIGTRGSELALAQAHQVRDAIVKLCNVEYSSTEIVPIKTSGDKIQNKDLSQVGGKGLFIKEIEEQLLLNNIDIAVHSTKDIPAFIPEDLVIAAYLPRDYAEDIFISTKFASLEDLPNGATFGTSSPRRRVQVQMVRPDLQFVLFRGNVGTRLQKLKDGHADATSLALCGVKRLAIDLAKEGFKSEILPKDRFIPAVGQGIISVECRKKDKDLIKMLQQIDDQQTRSLILAERAFLETLKGTCKTPMAAHAEYIDNKIALYCMLSNEEGTKVRNVMETGDIFSAQKIGIRAAKTMQKLFV